METEQTRKPVEFAQSAPRGLDEQRAAFSEAARIEMFAEMDAGEKNEREPWSRLLLEGTAVGPVRLEKIGERQAKATATGGFPLDASELAIGHGKKVNILSSGRTKTATLGILAIRRHEIILGTKKGWTPPAEPVFLVRDSANFAGAIYHRLNRPGPEWPPAVGPLQLGTGTTNKEHGENFVECLRICTGENGLCGIKGPPGTGKTHLLGWAAATLAKEGKSVLIATQSHAAVETALGQTAKIAAEIAPGTRIAKKVADGEDLLPELSLLGVGEVDSGDMKDPELFGKHSIVGTTLASLVRSEQIPQADYLFLDEAGQIPAFTACACAGMARNMVLFGDENQLPPVLQGEHHDHLECAHSAMAFLRYRMPERTRTLLVNHRANAAGVAYTQRNHYPDILLTAGKNTDARVEECTAEIDGETVILPGEGTHVIEIEHSNRKKHAPEESEAACAIVLALLGKTLHMGRETRALETTDFAVLCPNKRQAENVRRALERSLPKTLPVPECGTVHKLQGQGRAVVIFCATASHTGYIEAQAEFLFAKPLWNVATSRAIALTLILGNRGAISSACPRTLAGLELKSLALESLCQRNP